MSSFLLPIHFIISGSRWGKNHNTKLSKKTDVVVYRLLYYLPELRKLVFTCNKSGNKQ